MKPLAQTVCSLFFMGISSAYASDVTLTSGFHATVSEAIEGPNGTSIYTYVVRGGSTLTLASGEQIDVSIDCLGTDQTLGETVSGAGNCVWRASEKDQLFVSLATEEGANTYTVTGGAGRFSGATGSLTTSFVYLPSPKSVYLGVERGHGSLNVN